MTSAPFAERAAADRHARVVREAGAVPELRRTQTLWHGSRWVVRVRTQAPEQAHAWSREFTRISRHPHSVRARPEPSDVVQAAGPAARSSSVPARIDAATEVRFVYVRHLADGRRLRHHFVQLPGVTQVRVTTEAGEPWLSLRVESDIAVFAGPDGAWHGADLHRARETVAALGPAEVLRPVWADASDTLQVDLAGEVIDAVVPLPATIDVRRGAEHLDHVEIEVLDLDPPRADNPVLDAGT